MGIHWQFYCRGFWKAFVRARGKSLQTTLPNNQQNRVAKNRTDFQENPADFPNQNPSIIIDEWSTQLTLVICILS
jgi:hypothetical protein